MKELKIKVQKFCLSRDTTRKNNEVRFLEIRPNRRYWLQSTNMYTKCTLRKVMILTEHLKSKKIIRTRKYLIRINEKNSNNN